MNLIGNTPMVKIDGVFAKLENKNPTGSIKDRIAYYILKQAEKNKELKKGSEIVELTTGNTGISFAMLAAIKGYKLTVVMPEFVSEERKKIIEFYGGKVVLTPAKENMKGAKKVYEELLKKKKAWTPNQFENKYNIMAHKKTAKEILSQKPDIDVFVAGVGTGGTLIGIAKELKKKKVKIVAVEPKESAVMSGKKPGIHNIQGIGEGFVPPIVEKNMDLIDEVIEVSSKDAFKESKRIAREHGIFVGISSGANLLAAKKFKGNVVTVFPDSGERYLSLC